MKKYLLISTLIHLTILTMLSFNTPSINSTAFKSGKYSVEVVINNLTTSAKELGQQVKNSYTIYTQAGIETLAKIVKYNEPPKYPLLALRNGWTGEVLLGFYINSNGNLDNVKIVKSSGCKLLDQTALASAAQWQFKQGDKNLLITYPVKFILEE